MGGPWREGGRGRVAARGPRAALPARQPGLVVRAGIATIGCIYMAGCHFLVHSAPMYRTHPQNGVVGSRRGNERNVFFRRFVAQLCSAAGCFLFSAWPCRKVVMQVEFSCAFGPVDGGRFMAVDMDQTSTFRKVVVRPAETQTSPATIFWPQDAIPTFYEWLTGDLGLRVRGVRFRYAGFCTGDAPDERRSGAMYGHRGSS